MFIRTCISFLICSMIFTLCNIQQADAGLKAKADVEVTLFQIVDENGDKPTKADAYVFESIQNNPMYAPDGHHLTLGELHTVGGSVTVECLGAETHVVLDLTGLTPEGVYTAWSDFYDRPGFANDDTKTVGVGALGLNDGSTSIFIASKTGEASLDAMIPQGPLSMKGEIGPCALDNAYEYVVWIAYHLDGKTHGIGPGPAGTWTTPYWSRFRSGEALTPVEPQGKVATTWSEIKTTQ